jgi:hypothetical protein
MVVLAVVGVVGVVNHVIRVYIDVVVGPCQQQKHATKKHQQQGQHQH